MPKRPPQHRHRLWKPREETRREYDKARAKEHNQIYDRGWQALRKAFVQDHPLCRHCEAEGMIVAGQDVDHIIPVRIAPERRLDVTNCQHLCKRHHSLKSAEDRAKYGV